MNTQSFAYISKLVRDKSAIVLESGKSYLVESRLSPIIREEGLDNLERLIEELMKPTSKVLTQKVVEAMTTNETSFNRDVHPFQALKATILPELIAKKSRERTLNIWSNACSSGQEIYTIAMLLKESFQELGNWRVKLLGTDLSSQILAKASQGTFNQTEVNRGLPLPMLLKYFTRDGMHWKISDDIKRMVEFKEMNLIEPFPPSIPQMDIVFLRNVLIYFSTETKVSILQKVHKCIAPGGYLFLGGAESTMNLNVPFERTQIGQATVYRPI